MAVEAANRKRDRRSAADSDQPIALLTEINKTAEGTSNSGEVGAQGQQQQLCYRKA